MDALVGGFKGVKNTSSGSQSRGLQLLKVVTTFAARHADDVQHEGLERFVGRIPGILRRARKHICERGQGKSLDWGAHV